MINYLSFNDFRMFIGHQNIQFSPITIFTGPNNSGKSTLIKFIKKLVDYSNALWLREPDLMDFLTDYNLSYSKPYEINDSHLTDYQKEMALSSHISEMAVREIVVNNVSFKYDQNAKFATSVHFSENGILLATIDPIGFSYGEDTNASINIHLDNILKLKSKWYSGHFKKRSVEFKKNLEIIMGNEWPEALFKTSLNSNHSNAPLFRLDDDTKNDFQIILYEHSHPYRSILNDSYLSFMSCYSRDLIEAIRRNPSLPQNYIEPFINVLEFIFKFFILSELHEIKKVHDDHIFYSAYRGSFITESESQASRSFKMLNEKMSGLISAKKEKGFKSLGQLIHKNDALLLKKWLNMFEIGDEMFMDVKQLNTFKISNLEGIERYPFELGFGNQQLLPLILGILSNPSSLWFIEEPESHLHPYLQSMLADFFVDAAKSRNYMPGQLIIETHSEYLIRKLQYLVAKKTINPDDISLYYIHRKDKMPPKAKQIQRMQFTKDGSLDHSFGPGFFDEADNLAIELFNLKQINKN